MLSNRKTTITFFLIWTVLVIAAWFMTPVLLRNAIRLAAVLPHRSVAVELPDNSRTQLMVELVDLKKELAEKKLRGENVPGQLILDIGIRYETLGALWKAYPYVLLATRREPTNTSAWAHLASVQESMTLYQPAVGAWREAIERDPKNALFYERLAYLNDRWLNDDFTANGVYLEGLVRAGNPPGLMRTYAQFLEEVGEYNTALLYWKALQEKDPQDTTIQEHIRALENQL